MVNVAKWQCKRTKKYRVERVNPLGMLGTNGGVRRSYVTRLVSLNVAMPRDASDQAQKG